MAHIKDETLLELAEYLVTQTMDGNIDGKGLTRPVVYSTIKACIQSEKSGSLLCSHAFHAWLKQHREGIKNFTQDTKGYNRG